MAREFTTGFEMGDLLEFEALDSEAAITGTKRTGVYAMRLREGAGNSYAQKDLTAQDEYFFRFGFRPDITDSDAGRIIQWMNGGTELGSLRMAGSRSLQAYVGGGLVASSAAWVLTRYAWHLIEVRVKIADAGGVIQVKVDGLQVIDYTGDTKPGAATQINRFQFRNTIYKYQGYDDVAVNDTTGGVDNTWPGDGRVIAIMPNGVGNSTQFTPSAGANWECVDERPPSGTDYVYSSTIDQKDLYALAACGLTDETILRVYEEIRAREELAEGGEIACVIRTVATDYQGSDQALNLAYKVYKGAEYLLNPNTSLAWTIPQIDALEAGVVCR